MSIGRIKLHRKITDRERYTDANTVRLFLHCTLLANHSDKSWRGISILRGSFITSIEHLATDLKLSPQKIRSSLDKLIVTNEIAKKSTNKYTMITLVKYCDYNDLDCENNKQITNKSTNKQQTNNKQITTTKECKEGEEQKEDKKEFFSGDIDMKIIEFVEYRKQLKEPMTQKSVTVLRNKLLKVNHPDIIKIEMLDRAMINNRKSVYDLKDDEIKRILAGNKPKINTDTDPDLLAHFSY